MTRRSSLMSKVMVFLLALAVVFTYSVMPMNMSYAASAKKPAKVTIKTAKATSTSAVKVTWKKAKNAKKYEIWYSTKAKKGFKKGATVTGAKKTSGTVKKLKASKKYYFKVRAVNGKKKGAFSKVKAATTKKGPKEIPRTLGPTKGRTMITTIDMSDSKYDGKTVKVWVPIAQTDDYQIITINEEEVIKGITADKVEINTENEHGNKMLYIEWGKTSQAAKRVATFKYSAVRAKAGHDTLVYDPKASIPADVKPYITEESEYVKVNDPVVQEYAAEAVGNLTKTDEKARAIYDWVIDNLERIDNGETLSNGSQTKTFDVDGCGYGDTVKILKDLKSFGRAGGHCTDINSTFVALCRAAGIPAREMFGIRLNTNATGGQHCWAEFYLPGTGWVYADPGDVLKAVKGNNKGMTVEEVKAAKAKANREEFWGWVDNNRIVLSTGRDVTFNPAQAWGVCNTFGYPAAEIDGQRLATSFADAAKFKYTIECVNTVTASDLEASLSAKTYKIIDARKAADYEAAHIDGAVSADVSGAVSGTDEAGAKANIASAVSGDPAGTKYAIICYTGNKYANAAVKFLKDLDVSADNIFILGQDDGTQGPKGGMVAWGSRKKVSTVPAVKENTVYVTPQWLYSAKAGGQEGYEDVVVVEVNYDTRGNSTYEKGHVPGAIMAGVVEVEDATGDAAGAYNLLKAEEVRDYLLSHGITSDTKVVLYDAGGDPCEVGRQAYGYLWCGVKDVKILNGHLKAWTDAGYATETTPNEGKAASDFGVEVPAHPEYWTSIEEARAKLDKSASTYQPNFKVISIRSENEWLGKTSGYGYMDVAGDPEGAVWGKGAQTAFDVADFVNADGTVKNLAGFKAVWSGCDFDVDNTAQHLSFYCGTGWRATVPFLVLYENGRKDISVFDGGWYEWIMHPDYPVQVGDPKDSACVHTTVDKLGYGAGNYNYLEMNADKWASLGIAKTELKADDVLIDVREAEDYAKGTIPGAKNITVSNPYTTAQQTSLMTEINAAKAAGKRVVFICYTGNMRAKNAMQAVQDGGAYMGVDKITYLIGGFDGYAEG